MKQNIPKQARSQDEIFSEAKNCQGADRGGGVWGGAGWKPAQSTNYGQAN